MNDKRHEPPKEFEFTFCPQCGRDDLHVKLEARHYAKGKLCSGLLITVTYKRVEESAKTDRTA